MKKGQFTGWLLVVFAGLFLGGCVLVGNDTTVMPTVNNPQAGDASPGAEPDAPDETEELNPEYTK